MQAYGADRFRMAGRKVVLYAALPKGWTPRRERQGTHAEFPGTAVFWGDAYYEVVAAEALPAGGVRYVLEPWKDEHTIRVFLPYDEASEAALLADHQRARAQRRRSVAARLSGILLGNLPEHAQQRLANDLGVSPPAMTLLSTLPSVVLLGTCFFLRAGAMIDNAPSPVPFWVWPLAFFWFFESLIRFFVVMTQGRGMGSLIGGLWYVVAHPREAVQGSRELLAPRNVEITPDIELADRLTMRGPLLTLLTVAEQQRLAERYAFDYRRHAYAITWILLGGSFVGVVSSLGTLAHSFRLSAVASLIAAGILMAEQAVRLRALRKGPAASVLAFVVRPFVRDLL
jgi:hypothetical protein